MPLAFLWGGTLAWIAGLFTRNSETWGFLLPAGRLALFAGVLGAWASVYTGSLADARVVRSLCDPTIVEAHEEYAYWVSWIFTASLAIDLVTIKLPIKTDYKDYCSYGIALTFLIGIGLLSYVGHLGARLVYQQGAGVYDPNPTCREFE